MRDLPLGGDTGLPWFDPDWPWNGPAVQRFLDTGFNRGVLETTVMDVDLELANPVAMFAGADGDYWDDCANQCILIRNSTRWQVLTRAPKRSELLKWFDKDEVEYVWANQRPSPTIFDYGEEGTIRSWVMHDYRGVIRFEGDQTIRQVVDTLMGWGLVTSRYWPGLLEKFPQFQKCEMYLAELGALWSDGSHPLHQSVAPDLDQDNVALLKSRIPPMPQLPGGKNSPRLIRCFWQNANWGVKPPCCDAREICRAIWPEESRTDIESLKGNRLSRAINYLNTQFLDLDIAITFHEAGDDVTMEDYRN